MVVAIAIAWHSVFLLSIFDIYFTSPIVHGMQHCAFPLSPHRPQRVILFVSDGLRADTAFALDDQRGVPRMPFLRNIILEKGTCPPSFLCCGCLLRLFFCFFFFRALFLIGE